MFHSYQFILAISSNSCFLLPPTYLLLLLFFISLAYSFNSFPTIFYFFVLVSFFTAFRGCQITMVSPILCCKLYAMEFFKLNLFDSFAPKERIFHSGISLMVYPSSQLFHPPDSSILPKFHPPKIPSFQLLHPLNFPCLYSSNIPLSYTSTFPLFHHSTHPLFNPSTLKLIHSSTHPLLNSSTFQPIHS